MKKTVVIGFVGSQLDYAGKTAERWNKWRPSIALCQQDDFIVHRFELLHDSRSQTLAEQVASDIAAISPETEVRHVLTELRDPWDFEEVYTCLHDFARRYPFDTDHEDYLIHITTGTHVAQICWFLLAEAHYLPARLLQASPPRKKEFGNSIGSYALIDLDLSRYNQIAQRFAHEHDEHVSLLKAGITTRNPAFNHMIERIEHVASRSKAPLLLVGPTGAGKSFLARRVYELKRQRQALHGRFVEVNCATLRGDSAMSTLFGHVKGAFTGALNERPGLLRAADGGLLFLDEIGELGLDEQAMLLKAIEEKSFFPFGADKEASSDFQLLAGTHRDLRQWVVDGRFREDLYARINLWTFNLPGLSERSEDIAPNLEFELERLARENGEKVRFNTEAKQRYLAFACSAEARWAGNFREFSASLTRLTTLADRGRINEALVDEEIERLRFAWALGRTASASARKDNPAYSASPELLDVLGAAKTDQLDLFDRCQLATVIGVCREVSSLSQAGRVLFAASRQEKVQANDADRLRKYLARFELDFERVQRGRHQLT